MWNDRHPKTLLAAVLAASLVPAACAHRSSRPVEASDSRTAPSSYTSHSTDGGPQFRTISRHSDASTSAGTTSGDGNHVPETPPARRYEELSVSELESRARERELGGREYEWHGQPREVHGHIECPDVEIVEYEGSIIAYNRPIEINPAFRSRLKRFERIVREVAVEVYGRAPDRIVQYGGHVCRTIGGDGEKLSEHTFGHAIDVAGFDFDPLPATHTAELTHRRAAGEFEVRVEDHWNASFGFERRHRRFLRRLAATLEWRGPFSGMLGPAYPGHDEMFHFDFGPEFFFRL